MSVINQMLQDLETRRGALETQTLDHMPLRPAGVIDERRMPKFAIPAAAVIAVLWAIVAWWMLRDKPAAVPAAAPVAPIAAVVPPGRDPTARSAPAQVPAQTLPAASAPVATVTPVPENVAASVPAQPTPAPSVTPHASAKPVEPATPPPAKLAALMDASDAPAAAPAAEKMAPSAPRESARTPRERATAPIPGMETEVQNFKQRNPQQRIDERYRDALRKLNEGQFAAARADLTEVLQSQPKHSGARLALVGIELEEKRTAQAEKLLRDGISLQPHENAFSMALARLEVERGDVDAALTTLGRAQNSAGGDADYHGFYAALLQRVGRHAEAIEHYQLALRQREAANWLVGLAISLEAANRTRDAEQIYRRAQQSAGLTPELQDFAGQRLQQLRR